MRASRSSRSVQVDRGYLARGASTGFTVLFIGGLLYPLVSAHVPALRVAWLVLVAGVGFASAGRRIGEATSPALHGAIAAVLGYVLVVPLILIINRGVDVGQLGLTVLAAAAVGAVAGYLASRARSTADKKAPRRGR